MGRCRGIDRLNRYPKDNKNVLEWTLKVKPKKGKMAAVVEELNKVSLLLITAEVCSKYTVSDFFLKSNEVFSFITKNKLCFLEGHITNRGNDIQIGIGGFGAYESIHPDFLSENKETILSRLYELDLVEPV